MKLTYGFKLWIELEKGPGILGDGKCRLLKTVDEFQSLNAASKELNISYRKAWGDIKKAEEYLNCQLIAKERGGVNGGKSYLTTEGKLLVQAYDKLHNKVSCLLDNEFDTFLKEIKIGIK